MSHYIAVTTRPGEFNPVRVALCYESAGALLEDYEMAPLRPSESVELFVADAHDDEHEPVDPNGSLMLRIRGEES